MGDGSMWKKLSVLLIPIVLFAAQPLQVLAQQSQSPTTPQPPQWYGPGPWHMWSDGYGWHFWWMFPVMMLFMMLICGVGVYFLSSRLSSGPMDRQWNTSYSALGILDERYARGEISEGRVPGKEGRDSLWSVALTATVKRSWVCNSSTPRKTNVRVGSSTDLTASKSDFRSSPKSGTQLDHRTMSGWCQ